MKQQGLPGAVAGVVHLLRNEPLPVTLPDVEVADAAAAEGVAALIARAPGQSSDGLRRRLMLKAASIGARSALQLEELRRVSDALAAAGVPFLVWKGPVLSLWLYADPLLRPHTDIDIAIPSESRHTAELALRRLGYEDSEPLSDAQRNVLYRFEGQLTFVRDEFAVDLHTRFSGVQFPFRLSVAEAMKASAVMQLPGVAVTVPGGEDLAVLTVTHAAKHLWSRLEMITQIDALARLPLDWKSVDERAEECRVARIVGASFAVAARVLGTVCPPLPKCSRAARGVEERAALLAVSNLGSPARRSDMSPQDGWVMFDRRRDAVRALLAAVFVPTHQDLAGTEFAAAGWLRRPVRLLMRGRRRGRSHVQPLE